MEVNWRRAYKIEAEFIRTIAGQIETGFLLDSETTSKHISHLTGRIDEIEASVVPLLPVVLVPYARKEKGVYPYVKSPFLKNGKYTKYVKDWYTFAGWDESVEVVGPFTRFSFEPFDVGSLKQVKAYLLGEGWVPLEWNVNKETKERTSPKLSQQDEFIGVNSTVGKSIAERFVLSHRRSQLTGFLKRVRPDGRISANISGITPTSRLKHKDIVNIPGRKKVFGREMREVFIAKEGYKLVGCDAASCQLRMLCHYMGDDNYTKAVVSGNDEDQTSIHYVNMRNAGLKTKEEAKTFIYAFLFGEGDALRAAKLGLTISQGRKVKKKFLDSLPKLKSLIKCLTDSYKQRGYLVGLDGRKIYVRSAHMYLVYLLQSAEAIMMKVATLYAHKMIREEGLDAKMVAHVHDEFQWEVIAKDSIRVGELLENAIVKAGNHLELTVPMAGGSKIGDNWNDTH